MPAISISAKNDKLGNIPSVSLPPVKTCIPGSPCIDRCYARRISERYAISAMRAWEKNLELWTSDPDRYMRLVFAYIAFNEPTHFRWHVSGDIPSDQYFDWMDHAAGMFPSVKFMAFTRHTKYCEAALRRGRDNLKLIRSVWIGEKVETEAPRFNVLEKGAEITGRECSGRCDSCYACWNAKPGSEVSIHVH